MKADLGLFMTPTKPRILFVWITDLCCKSLILNGFLFE